MRWAGRCGVAATALLAISLSALPTLPGSDASSQAVFAFFLDSGSGLRVGSAAIVLGLLFVAVLFAAVRQLLAMSGAAVLGTVMLTLALLAVAVQAFAAAILVSLAISSESADPATSRELLDLAEIAVGISGPAFSIALLACAMGTLWAAETLPRPLSAISTLAAACTLLWGARLLSDSGELAAGSFAGSTLGWIGLLAWTAATGLWLASDQWRRPQAPTPSRPQRPQ